MLPVLWNDEAYQDIDDIAMFIGRDNRQAADRLTDRIWFTAERLGSSPYAYRQGREPGTREAVAHPNYIIVYRIERDSIRIVRVVHASRQYP